MPKDLGKWFRAKFTHDDGQQRSWEEKLSWLQLYLHARVADSSRGEAVCKADRLLRIARDIVTTVRDTVTTVRDTVTTLRDTFITEWESTTGSVLETLLQRTESRHSVRKAKTTYWTYQLARRSQTPKKVWCWFVRPEVPSVDWSVLKVRPLIGQSWRSVRWLVSPEGEMQLTNWHDRSCLEISKSWTLCLRGPSAKPLLCVHKVTIV